MKHVFTQLSPNTFDYELYYNEDDAVNDNFWAGGNRNFAVMNNDFIADIHNNLDDLYFDLKVDEQPDKLELVNAYFDRATPFTKAEANKLCELAAAHYEAENSEELHSITCKVLQILKKGEPFIYGTIKGVSQGDWSDYICPEDFKEQIPYVEAVLFATGEEWQEEDGTCYYVYKSYDVKKELSEASGYPESDIVLRRISGQHIVYDYTEE